MGALESSRPTMPSRPIISSTINPTMAAQLPMAEGHVDAWELGHIPMAIAIPSGVAKRRTNSTSRRIRRALVTTSSLARKEKVGRGVVTIRGDRVRSPGS